MTVVSRMGLGAAVNLNYRYHSGCRAQPENLSSSQCLEFEGLATIFVSRWVGGRGIRREGSFGRLSLPGVGRSSLMPCTKYGRIQNY